MDTISFDSGIREYRIGGGVLRFNPADPNLYARFLDGMEQLRKLEDQADRATEGAELIRVLEQTDSRMKEILSRIFGGENDFSVILQGVNLLAVGENGERVITNLFSALIPILQEGVQTCIREKTAEAVKKADLRRTRKC